MGVCVLCGGMNCLAVLGGVLAAQTVSGVCSEHTLAHGKARGRGAKGKASFLHSSQAVWVF